MVGYILAKMFALQAIFEIADTTDATKREEEPSEEPSGHVTSISVLRPYRRLGLANRLMRQARELILVSYNHWYLVVMPIVEQRKPWSRTMMLPTSLYTSANPIERRYLCIVTVWALKSMQWRRRTVSDVADRVLTESQMPTEKMRTACDSSSSAEVGKVLDHDPAKRQAALSRCSSMWLPTISAPMLAPLQKCPLRCAEVVAEQNRPGCASQQLDPILLRIRYPVSCCAEERLYTTRLKIAGSSLRIDLQASSRICAVDCRKS